MIDLRRLLFGVAHAALFQPWSKLHASPRALIRRAPIAAPDAAWRAAAAEFDVDSCVRARVVLSGITFDDRPTADPEDLHDRLRCRGVGPLLARLYMLTEDPAVLRRLGEAWCNVASVADWRPSTGWDSTTSSLRLLSLVDTMHQLGGAAAAFRAEHPWLERFIARHRGPLWVGGLAEPPGNHRFINAAGQAAWHLLASPHRPLADSEVYRLRGVLARQFLADGGHIERVPHYHHAVLSLYSLLAEIDSCRHGRLASVCDGVARGPLDALSIMLEGRDGLARFGDMSRSLDGRRGCGRVRPTARDVKPLEELPEFGLVRRTWTSPRGAFQLFVDTGPTGLSINPGHGHDDVLSFTLSVNHQSVLADPGTFTYANDDRAIWFRRRAAHSAISWVQADLEPTSYFRWRKVRPAPHPRYANGRLNIHAAWSRPGKVLCQLRAFEMGPDGLSIHDVIRASIPQRGWHRLVLDPSVSVQGLVGRTARLSTGIGPREIRADGVGLGNVVAARHWYAPRYGVRVSTLCLMWRIPAPAGGAEVLTTVRLV
jgi:Heparinase II/III-like protein